jgi:hypothetical protein
VRLRKAGERSGVLRMRRHNDTVDSRHHPVDDGQRRWLVADDALLGCGAVAAPTSKPPLFERPAEHYR